jgi:hypothetical protein
MLFPRTQAIAPLFPVSIAITIDPWGVLCKTLHLFVVLAARVRHAEGDNKGLGVRMNVHDSVVEPHVTSSQHGVDLLWPLGVG